MSQAQQALPAHLTPATRAEARALLQKAYDVGMKKVAEGDPNPELKRELARARKHLNGGK